MRFVSPLLKQIVYPCLAGTGYLRTLAPTGLAVVTYHGVLPPEYTPIDSGFDGSLITAEVFRRQLRLLKRKYTVITPAEMHDWCRGERDLPPRAALITCDDGFLNNLTEMVPILQEEGLRCLFFVTGASAGEHRTMLWHEELLLMFLRAPAGNFEIEGAGIRLQGTLGSREQRRTVWWGAVKKLSHADAQAREQFMFAGHACFSMERSLEHYLATYPKAPRHFCLLTRPEVQQLAAAGMTIGAHSMTHSILSQLPRELAWAEMVECRARLESVIGKPIWAFAYPFGDADSTSPMILAMAKQAGFAAAFLNVGGGLGSELPLHAIPRVHVNSGMRLPEFEAHVSGFYESLQRRMGRAHRPELIEPDSSTSGPPPLPEPVSQPKIA